jgi:hypothetical protein
MSGDPHLGCPEIKVEGWNILDLLQMKRSESFIPFTVYRNGAPIGNIDTEYNRQFNMDIGEQWTLK